MADKQHGSLTEADGLHELKGVAAAPDGRVPIASGGATVWSTAEAIGTGAAPAGSVQVADGTGGGSFLRYQGWGQYEDSRDVVGTPSQTLTSGVRTKLLNNGAGLTLEKLPSDAVAPLWDVTNNKHAPIAAFDIYHLRLSFTVENYSGTTPYLDIELDIGGSIGTVFSRGVNLRKSGAAQQISAAFPVFSGPTYLVNGGEFYLTYTGTAPCDVYKTSLLVIRESKNFV